MRSFQYHKPASVNDAAALASAQADSKLLAGGQSLVQSMKLRLATPSDLIDLRQIAGLRGIKVGAGALTIGAMTTHAEVAGSAEVKKALPALAHLASEIGDRQVRALGTIGGSLANNDPAADYPAAVLGLAATIETSKRKISADDFFTGMFETALAQGEIITAVSFPIPQRAAYQKFKNPASRFAIVGVMVSQGSGGVRVAVTGAAPSVFRATQLEQALTANFSPAAVANIKFPSSGLNTDIHASNEYRAHLITVLAARAVQAAL